MQTYKASVHVRLKEGILDPQGQAISHALRTLGFHSISSVRTGKLIELIVQGDEEKSVRDQIEQACQRLLANPVIEEYEISLTKL